MLTCSHMGKKKKEYRAVFTKGLRLKVESFVSSFCPKTAKTFVLGLVVFTKNLRPVLGLAKGSTLRLVGSGLKAQSRGVKEHLRTFIPLSIVMLQ